MSRQPNPEICFFTRIHGRDMGDSEKGVYPNRSRASHASAAICQASSVLSRQISLGPGWLGEGKTMSGDKLTESHIKVKIRDATETGKRPAIPDGELGYRLLIAETGTCTWAVMIADSSGKPTQITPGQLPLRGNRRCTRASSYHPRTSPPRCDRNRRSETRARDPLPGRHRKPGRDTPLPGVSLSDASHDADFSLLALIEPLVHWAPVFVAHVETMYQIV
jgi:hypothetical protein